MRAAFVRAWLCAAALAPLGGCSSLAAHERSLVFQPEPYPHGAWGAKDPTFQDA